MEGCYFELSEFFHRPILGDGAGVLIFPDLHRDLPPPPPLLEAVDSHTLFVLHLLRQRIPSKLLPHQSVRKWLNQLALALPGSPEVPPSPMSPSDQPVSDESGHQRNGSPSDSICLAQYKKILASLTWDDFDREMDELFDRAGPSKITRNQPVLQHSQDDGEYVQYGDLSDTPWFAPYEDTHLEPYEEDTHQSPSPGELNQYLHEAYNTFLGYSTESPVTSPETTDDEITVPPTTPLRPAKRIGWYYFEGNIEDMMGLYSGMPSTRRAMCTLCGYSFRTSQTVRTHSLSVHYVSEGVEMDLRQTLRKTKRNKSTR